MYRLALVLVLIALFACNRPVQKSNTSIKKTNMRSASNAAKQSFHSKQDTSFLKDSLEFDRALSKALTVAEKQHNKGRFKWTFNVANDLEKAEIKMAYGKLLGGKDKYLILTRSLHGILYLDVFKWNGNSFKKEVSYHNDALIYEKYIIRDINGDGKRDFLINYFPSSGCCLRDSYLVYLNDSAKPFSRVYNFINPVFSPAEKLIRGLDYGQPGEASFYKYRWNGDKIDTVEYIVHADTVQKSFYRIQNWDDRNFSRKRIKLTAIPNEYRRRPYYNWFIGKV